MTIPKECAQCEEEFQAKSVNNVYCSRACQLDGLRGVDVEVTKRRKATGFAWDPVRAAKPVKITLPKVKTVNVVGRWKKAVVIPDPQFGYHWTEEGLDPFHDERALKIARDIVIEERPDVTVLLGDVLDEPMFGKYRQYPSFVHTFVPTLDRAHEEIAIYAEASKEVRYLSGNHDERLHMAAVDNMFAAAGVRQAKRTGEPGEDDWPVLSVPHLLRLPELKVDYIGAYPAGATYLNDNLACIHGRLLGNAGRSAAQAVVEDERVSVIFGHTHKASMACKTQNMRHRASYTIAYSPGCLCRVDGTVPSTKSGMDAFGMPIKSWENWQQGVGVVLYDDNGRFHIEDVRIIEGWAVRDDGTEYLGDGHAQN